MVLLCMSYLAEVASPVTWNSKGQKTRSSINNARPTAGRTSVERGWISSAPPDTYNIIGRRRRRRRRSEPIGGQPLPAFGQKDPMMVHSSCQVTTVSISARNAARAALGPLRPVALRLFLL